LCEVLITLRDFLEEDWGGPHPLDRKTACLRCMAACLEMGRETLRNYIHQPRCREGLGGWR
jgi:hypothetical protein